MNKIPVPKIIKKLQERFLKKFENSTIWYQDLEEISLSFRNYLAKLNSKDKLSSIDYQYCLEWLNDMKSGN